ncbi:MAG: PD40 domain-containing protein, partial [Gemmatimonadetes bacterium]|nr:PD40 domain-containing protein [Gemmatimonadota bacterium]
MSRALRHLACAGLFFACAAPLRAQVDARMLRYPAVSADRIAFVYAGDVWVVPKSGGTAERLTSARGEESFPRFSPDGSKVAFTGNYDGTQDVYVIPTLGGIAQRITHHPAADRVVGWYPDGKSLLVASSMTSEKDRFNKLFQVPATGGLPRQLPMPYGEFGAISPDGKRIAYTPGTRDFRTWKRYRGGWMQDIWLFDLEAGTARKLTPGGANYTQPMWHGATLYFLSDRGANERNNLWALDTRTGAMRQVTDFADYDVRFPSIGPNDIVFEQGGRLFLLDLATEKYREVKVDVVTDLATLRPRAVRVATLIQRASISPTGKRAVFEARGEVFTVPAEHGVVRDVTNTSGSAERTPTWSPDGRWLAYWSDRTGEYELTVRPADGSGAERTVTRLGAGFRYTPYWSPDSRKIAFIDQAMRIHVVDVATGADQVVDQAMYYSHGALAQWRPSWSADARWLAYDRDLPSRRQAIFLYDTRTGGRPLQATSGFYSASSPAFDPDGKYLYFLSDRRFAPAYSSLDNSWIYPNATVIMAAPLRPDVPTPIAPKDDEEAPRDAAAADTAAKGRSAGAKGGNAGAKGADAAPRPAVKPVEIDVAGLERRAVELPVPAGNFTQLDAVAGKVVYRRAPRTGSPRDARGDVAYWDLGERKEEAVVEGVDFYDVSADGKKLLVLDKERWAILDLKPKQKIEKTLDVASMEAIVDPRAEWRQMFADVYRFYRDYFYDANLHGVNWAAERDAYARLLEDARTRDDVNFVIGEFIAEINSSHTYRGGGDVEQPETRGVGMLGVDFTLENGAFRIQRILEGAPWDSEVRSPLAESGVNVKPGDYLLAVNGRPLDTTQDPWAGFQGLAGATVQLTVNSTPSLQGARTVLVKTLDAAGEARLRNLAWIEANRKRVDEATGGRVGYVYVPDTGINGQNELVRQFYGQFDKDGLIIDERFNSGGQIPDRFVELLDRPIRNFWAVRDGHDWTWPPAAHNGPQVMLINGWSGSGGDAFPFYFRQAGLGPLIGKRTWGGLIGISGVPPLVDGGYLTVPTFAIYSTDGQWIIENDGVHPDIEVEDDPAQLAKGVDPQLEAAIAEVLKELKEKPPIRPHRPGPPPPRRPPAPPPTPRRGPGAGG